MDDHHLNLVTAFAALLSACGTIAAVVVALYLARRDERQRLEVDVDAGGYITGPMNEYGIVIAVTNIGRRSVRLNGLECHYKTADGPVRLRLNPPERHPGNSSLPIRLADGDQAFYFFKLEDLQESLMKLDLRSRKSALRSLNFVVCIAGGQNRRAAPGPVLRDQLKKVTTLTTRLGSHGDAA